MIRTGKTFDLNTGAQTIHFGPFNAGDIFTKLILHYPSSQDWTGINLTIGLTRGVGLAADGDVMALMMPFPTVVGEVNVPLSGEASALYRFLSVDFVIGTPGTLTGSAFINFIRRSGVSVAKSQRSKKGGESLVSR